jgi:cell division protein FtsQ
VLLCGGLGCSLLALALGSQELWRYVTTAEAFQIRSITFSGSTLLSEAALRQWVNVSKGENIFLVDLERIGNRLKTHPWVKRAMVWRILPDALFVEIEDRTPFAFVDTGHLYVIDGEGYVLQELPKAGGSDQLLKIQGLAQHTYRPGEQITDPALHTGFLLLKMIQHVEIFRGLRVTEIDVHSPERPILVLGDNQGTVRVAVADWERKLSLLHLITAYFPQQERDIEYIDLSFRDKIVVKPALVTATARE